MSFKAALSSQEKRIDWSLVGIGLVFLAAAALRYYGIDWDGGHLFHPDERWILMVTSQIALPWPLDFSQLLSPDSPLNPQSFAYGSFIFYLLKFLANLLSGLGNLFGGLTPLGEASTFDGLRFVGRCLSATFDLGTVVIMYFLGRRLYGWMAGLLASTFVAFSVLNIQLAHFYASDTLLTLFIVVIVYLSVRQLDQPSRRLTLLLGLTLGLALATKVSGLPVVLAIVAAQGLRLFVVPTKEGEGVGCVAGWRSPSRTELTSAVLSLVATGVIAVAVFGLAEPYALIDFPTFWANLNEQNAMVRGIADFPYTRQYADRAPYLYFLNNLVVWGAGWPLGLAMVAGLVWAVVRSLFKTRPAEVVVLAWVVPYFAITGSFHSMFLRYLLPITPFLALFAAGLLWTLVQGLRRRRQLNVARVGQQLRWPVAGVARGLAGVLVAVVVLLTLFYAVAYTNIYSSEHTGVAASKWIYQHVPNGAHLAIEHWEEGLPVSLPLPLPAGSARPEYIINTLNLYEDDGPAKVEHLVQRLQDADYIVFYSQRLYGTIPRLPARYPISSQYYRLLFSGQLGYQLDAYFTSYPQLLGVAFVDDTFSEPGLPVPAALTNYSPAPLTLNLGRADESFTVYDHPKVLIFKKMGDLSADDLRRLLTSG